MFSFVCASAAATHVQLQSERTPRRRNLFFYHLGVDLLALRNWRSSRERDDPNVPELRVGMCYPTTHPPPTPPPLEQQHPVVGCPEKASARLSCSLLESRPHKMGRRSLIHRHTSEKKNIHQCVIYAIAMHQRH